MKAHRELIKEAIKNGFTIQVHSEEGLEIQSRHFHELVDMVENLDESSLVFFDDDGLTHGSAYIVLYGNDDDETVSDYSMGPRSEWIDAWFNRVIMGRS